MYCATNFLTVIAGTPADTEWLTLQTIFHRTLKTSFIWVVMSLKAFRFVFKNTFSEVSLNHIRLILYEPLFHQWLKVLTQYHTVLIRYGHTIDAEIYLKICLCLYFKNYVQVEQHWFMLQGPQCSFDEWKKPRVVTCQLPYSIRDEEGAAFAQISAVGCTNVTDMRNSKAN